MDRCERAVDKAKDLAKDAANAVTGGEPGSDERSDQTGSGVGNGAARGGNGAGTQAQPQDQETRRSGTGTVVEVKGPVVDVRFSPEEIPEIYNALLVNIEIGGEEPRELTLEVQ